VLHLSEWLKRSAPFWSHKGRSNTLYLRQTFTLNWFKFKELRCSQVKVGSVRAVLWAGGLGSDIPEPNRLRQRVDADVIIRPECEVDKAKMWLTITIENKHSMFVIN